MAADSRWACDVISVLPASCPGASSHASLQEAAGLDMEADEGHTVEPVRSKELLGVGCSGGGLYDKLVINSKQKKKTGSCPPTVRMPRSSILDRVQNFLPQMAQANEDLNRDIQTCSDGKFDIENIEQEENIIEMNLALVELNSSDSSEGESDSSEESSASDSDGEVTEQNIRLRQKGKQGKIEELAPKNDCQAHKSSHP
ncbi:NOP protein chaperone 1 [Phyllobates terribilis]|uniref:NOP protein chaperone 1 n=1 Tax=Phyllobates terribilis TaxID=111132 RepID=UPI003CCB34B7